MKRVFALCLALAVMFVFCLSAIQPVMAQLPKSPDEEQGVIQLFKDAGLPTADLRFLAGGVVTFWPLLRYKGSFSAATIESFEVVDGNQIYLSVSMTGDYRGQFERLHFDGRKYSKDYGWWWPADTRVTVCWKGRFAL